jgi:hypothetical protein
MRGADAIGIREVGFWSVLIVAIAFWANIVRGTGPAELPGVDSMAAGVLENGAFDVFAWILVFARAARMFEAGPASWRRISATFLVGVIALAPVRLAAGVAFVILGGSLLWDRRALAAGRQVGLVLLALAFETVWTSRFLAQPHLLAGQGDAKITAFLLGLLHTEAASHANIVDNLSANFSISVWPYCASSFPLAGVGLAFLVMLLYLDQAPRRRHLVWLGMSFIGSFLLTEVRLVLLATSQASYFWWHNGPGVSIYAVAALALAVVFPILATWETGTAGTPPGDRLVA